MKSNDLAVWYLRLNGFLTVPNFVLHPQRHGSQLTEADIVGVRFPHRAEFDNHTEADDQRFAMRIDKPYFIIAESTNGMCKLNDPWTEVDAFYYFCEPLDQSRWSSPLTLLPEWPRQEFTQMSVLTVGSYVLALPRTRVCGSTIQA